MAKKNNYWGLVAVGALTAAAAGAVAAHLVKNHRKNSMLEDDFEDLDNLEDLDDFEERINEEKEAFQAWDIPAQEETETEKESPEEEAVPEENTSETSDETSDEEDFSEDNSEETVEEAPEDDTVPASEETVENNEN